MKLKFGLAALALAGLFAAPAGAETPQTWEVVNPMGVVKKANIKPAPRLASLDGKTIVLRWNGKHNGDKLLERVSELLAKKAPTAKIVKAWEKDTSMNKISGSMPESKRIAESLKAMGADLVIASQCD